VASKRGLFIHYCKVTRMYYNYLQKVGTTVCQASTHRIGIPELPYPVGSPTTNLQSPPVPLGGAEVCPLCCYHRLKSTVQLLLSPSEGALRTNQSSHFTVKPSSHGDPPFCISQHAFKPYGGPHEYGDAILSCGHFRQLNVGDCRLSCCTVHPLAYTDILDRVSLVQYLLWSA
jgi:hypothetical protein